MWLHLPCSHTFSVTAKYRYVRLYILCEYPSKVPHTMCHFTRFSVFRRISANYVEIGHSGFKSLMLASQARFLVNRVANQLFARHRSLIIARVDMLFSPTSRCPYWQRRKSKVSSLYYNVSVLVTILFV